MAEEMNGVRKLRVIADMEYSLARSHELKDLADEIEREHMDEINVYLDNEAKLINRIERLRKAIEYALNPDADREAAAGWVEEHGGIDELDKRLMPDGMEWPRFEDGEIITQDNVPYDAIAVCLALDGSCYSLHYDMPDDERMFLYETSERVKSPEPDVLAADGKPIKVGDTVYLTDGNVPFEVQSVRDGAAQDEFGEWYDSGLLTHTQPDTQKRIKAIESELAETKKQLAEEKANADGHWKNANNWAKQLEEARIENHNLKGVLAEFNFKLKLFLGTYAARFDENGMPKNIDKEPPSLLDLMGILKDGQKEEES